VFLISFLQFAEHCKEEDKSARVGGLSVVEHGSDKFVWNEFKQLGWPER
jgi:hypothetical protein